jgi:hypothetical protein
VTPLKDMKDGPAKVVVERELRSFVNDLEYILDLFAPTSDSPMAEAVRAHNRMLLDDIEMLLRERGIVPKGESCR